jgi:polyhydroxybutyrate depolymerase
VRRIALGHRHALGGALILAFGCGGLINAEQDEAAFSRPNDATGDASTFDSSALEPPGTESNAGDAGIPEAGSPLDSGEESIQDSGITPRPGSSGCRTGASLESGEHRFTLEGRDRRYILRLPKNYDVNRAWPLVLALHGNGGSASYWDGTSGSRNIRSVLENDAILVVAEAIDGQWRDYSQPSATWPARTEMELRYFDRVIEEVSAALCIDEDAIFAMGFSGGGSFSGVLGCHRAEIRAIAVGGSVLYFDPADCIHTPASWITIGTQELTDGRAAFRDTIRDRAGCASTTVPTAPAPCVAYTGCDPETAVHYCQHPDGHVWPEFGTEAAWGFFRPLVE